MGWGGCRAAFAVLSLALPVLGFMSYIVEPLFREWARFTGPSALSENMLRHLSHNKAQWKSLLPTPHRSGGAEHAAQGTDSDVPTGTKGDAP